jgi:RNA polymerase sigma factor (sigma-70 family)
LASDSDGTMRATHTNDTALIVAARSGDRRALDELVTGYLPLVYTIVRRALGGHSDVDDVVQEIMLRAVRQLRLLRDPESFRPWLASIAMRHVSTHLHRRAATARRLVALDAAADVPDDEADVEGLTLLRVELSIQRRQVVRATQWLDPDDRALLSLWWLETAGQLTRGDLAAALDVSIAHAGVRVQRMRNQLDLSRTVVAALEARPRCPGLVAAVADWDGWPSPLWRKRIARHTRSCAICRDGAEGMVAAERLLVGLALLPVPLTITASVIGKSALAEAAVGATATAAASAGAGTGLKAGILAQLVQAVGAHPVAASVAAGALVVGTTVTATQFSPSPPPAPPVIAAPTVTPTPAAPRTTAPAAGPTTVPAPPPAIPAITISASPALGPVSLEPANAPGKYVTTTEDYGVLAVVTAASGDTATQQATFEVVPGLADPTCLSFRSPDGRYLRHMMWRIRLHADEGTPLYRGDATFCVRTGTVAGTVWLESSNYPGWFLRHRGDELWVDHSDGSAAFQADSSFVVRSPLAG